MQDADCLSRDQGFMCSLLLLSGKIRKKNKGLSPGIYWLWSEVSSMDFLASSWELEMVIAASLHRGISQFLFCCVGLTDEKEIFDIAMCHTYSSNTENW